MISGTVPTRGGRIRVCSREGFEDPGGWLVYTKDGVLQPAPVAQVEGDPQGAFSFPRPGGWITTMPTKEWGICT